MKIENTGSFKENMDSNFSEEKNDKTAEQNDDDQSFNPFYRVIKTYVLRASRMTQAQERDYQDLSPVWCIPFAKSRINFIDIFGNTNPVIVEIGFGMGAATAEIAAANPDINYIGIEVHRPGIGKLLGEIRKRDLKNLFIIEHDALEVLEYMFVDNSVNGFHVFFPDPWQKKRHNKRRLIQRPHTDLLVKKLAVGAYLYMVTDWQPYAESALAELSATPGLINKYDGFAEKQNWRPETKFERRGIKEDRIINELYFIKNECTF